MKIMIDSEYLDKLQKSLGVDSNGNAVVGKNLEVDGEITINSGLDGIWFLQGDEGVNIYYSPEDRAFDVQDNEGRFHYLFGDNGIFDNVSGNYFVREDQLPKYYKHDLILSGANGTPVVRLNIISSKDLDCNSIQDLRMLLGITTTTPKSYNGFYYDTLEDYNNQWGAVNIATVFISTTICQTHNAGSDEGTNITTVSDTVSPL